MATPDGVIFHRMVDEHYYEGMPIPGCQLANFEKIKAMEFRDDDILVATYPKAGNYKKKTWSSVMTT